RLATDLPSAVKADDGRLRQVLTNILGNAIKFTETGSVSLSLSMTREGDLQFEVTDTGIGIDPDKIEQIFDHFTQAEASTTRRFGGTGLGLSISRHIVDVMGGHISVDSAVGKGSTFRVTVPVEVLEGFGFVATDGRHARVQEFGLKSGLSILIADDNRTNRFLLEKYLKDQPVEVQFAVDGRDALEKVATADFDLVFMDISMPNMGGVQATQEIRKLLKPQPTIVALTAHALEDERHLCVHAGMDDVLAKPIRKVEFLDWIAAFQRGAKQHESAF
ncbi:MAG: response regulator, partial [Shimia sp.]|nr:response regulator [Shimia sp.]